MPIYEYRCHSCQRKISIFFRSISSVSSPTCPHCGGADLDRLFSRVVVRRGGARDHGAGLDSDLVDDAGGQYGGGPGFGDDFGPDPYDADPFGFGDDADPREIARWTRHLSAQMGEPLEPDLERALSDMERGADPEEVMEQLEESEPGNWEDSE